MALRCGFAVSVAMGDVLVVGRCSKEPHGDKVHYDDRLNLAWDEESPRAKTPDSTLLITPQTTELKPQ
jgi:hypothetical protein